MARVLKSFTTSTRRFMPGDEFDPETNRDASLPLEHLIDKGFVEGSPQPTKPRGKPVKESKT